MLVAKIGIVDSNILITRLWLLLLHHGLLLLLLFFTVCTCCLGFLWLGSLLRHDVWIHEGGLDFATTHVSRVLLVGLDTLAGFSVVDDLSEAKHAEVCWIVDPSDVNETVVKAREWINEATSIGILPVVNHDDA